MQGLIKPLYNIKEYNSLLKAFRQNIGNLMVTGIFESQKSHIASGIINDVNCPAVFITHNELAAKNFYEDLKLFFKDRVLFYPSKEFFPYDIEAEGLSLTENRLYVLEKILSTDNYIIVLSVEALQNKIIPFEEFKKNMQTFKVGEKHRLDKLGEYFTLIGYKNSHMVEAKGQFSIRGEILDFFPVNSDNPFRIDFFDDEIDSIKTFDISSQRSIDEQKQVTVFPAKEIIFDKLKAQKAVQKIEADLEKVKQSTKDTDHFKKLKQRVYQDIEKINNGIFFAGIDKYISYFYDDTNILDYLPSDSMVFIDEYNKVEKTAHTNFSQFNEIIKDSIQKGAVLPQCINFLFQFHDLTKTIEKKRVIHLNTFLQNISNIRPVQVFNIDSKPIPSFNDKIDLLIEDLKEWKANNKKIVVLAGSQTKCENLNQILSDNDINSFISEDFTKPPAEGEILIAQGSLNKGFEYSQINFIVVSDKEILGEKKKKLPKKRLGKRIKTFTELTPGDYVVHHIHGIGKYLGTEKLKIEGAIKDYLKIKYLQGDLYVPVNQLDLIQKYVGSEGAQPKINKLGGADWKKVKSKVKASVQELAQKLIRLYAEREMAKGFAFSEDNIWQRQFEETFPYEETEDQYQCIEDTKKDMEKTKPMDRLLCGDVGYGKTEVALRAAFKAVMDGKQVAYLVPTTILVQQHYDTFVKRMKDFAINVEALSRFRTQKQQKKILKDLKDGLIDIIIGTHRLLQKDVQFKDLGLVIIDEEQRFGVSHKEKLKSLKNNVDVLTLTATPIPRTLHMALVGARDMSVIEDPPEDRFPVQTYVIEYNLEIIKDAIIKEINRGGQVFYLHNKISSIHKIAALIQQTVPEAKVVFAHGQMNKRELEDIMINFLNFEYDVLVCTTIIETGIDMQNVNTIIIEDADKMGLSQLYQLRGRVGRSNRQAYAHFIFKKDKVLTEEAQKRLKAIKDFTEFGSGFKIAMRDLEIRGAGNIIGPEQHGHMNMVGYEMYCKILEDTIKELKGEKVPEKTETTVDINISSYIPDEYIEDSLQKINMYKKISSIESEADIVDIRDELLDRFGDIPHEVNNLIETAYIKNLCSNLGISNLVQEGNDIIITFNNIDNLDLQSIGEISDELGKKVLFTASDTPYLTYKANEVPQEKLLENIKILLQNFNKYQTKE